MKGKKTPLNSLSTLQAALGEAYRIEDQGFGAQVNDADGFSVGWLETRGGTLSARISVNYDIDTPESELEALDERARAVLRAEIEAWEQEGWRFSGDFERGEYSFASDPSRSGASLDAEFEIDVETAEELRTALDFADSQESTLSLD